MYFNYIEKYNEENKDIILEEALEVYKIDEERRNEELFRFIDDFINSEEYEEYMQYKRDLLKIDKASQYCSEDLKHEEIEEIIPDKYPLTTQSKKMYALVRQCEKYMNNKKNLELLKKQQNGLKIIKEKILEIKKVYLCNKEEIMRQQEERNRKILEEYCHHHNLDLPSLTLKTKNEIRNKVLYFKKIVHSRNVKMKTNIMNIVRKLVKEYKRQKEIDKTLNKTYLYKVKKREKIIKDMEVVGQKIILKPRDELKDDILEEETVEEEQEIVKESPKKKAKGKEKKDKKKKEKKGTGKGSKKQSKKGSKKSSKKGKKQKKDKKDGSKLILPSIPICNLRKKINSENYQNLLNLVSQFEQIEEILQDRHMLARDIKKEYICNSNYHLLYEPKTITFKNFKSGKRYKRKIRILNGSLQQQKLRLQTISFENEYDTLMFKIEPLFGIQKLLPGCKLEAVVIFTPVSDFAAIDGNIIFLSCNVKTLKYCQFSINIRCLPTHPELIIEPATVNFGNIPIWRAKKSHTKIIKLTNDSSKPCKLVIRKITDPLELDEALEHEEYLEENTDENTRYIKDILSECLENVFNHFHFEDSYIKLDGFEKLQLKVTFKNVDHIGNYFEKYIVDVYETSQCDSIQYVGCQEITVTAETFDHFIKTIPECLDFGICVFNTIYQIKFEVCNSSSTTQTICVKFPSTMVDYIKTDVSNFYIPTQGKRTISLKFLPRKDKYMDITTYFDKQTSILEFPLYISVLSKIYLDVPPIKVTVFAILTPQKCLRILPKESELCSLFQNDIALDLGDSTVYESVFTELEIDNNTPLPQIYGFVDLPECLTIYPNYGFGELKPGEKKNLKIYFHPEVKDISNFTNDKEIDKNNVAFKITLETLCNIGEMKRELCYKKLRKSIDLVLKELKTTQNPYLIQDIKHCVNVVKSELFTQNEVEGKGNYSNLYSQYEFSEFGEYDEESLVKVESESLNKIDLENYDILTELWLKAKIIKPLVEFSHQFIEFPDTPCGSFSIVELEIRAFKTELQLECDYLKKKSRQWLPNYEAWFKITGDNEEIKIEPNCGTLRNGETKKIILVAKPKVPIEIVKSTAKSIKYSEIYEMKMQEYEMEKEKRAKKGKKGKDKTSSKGKKGKGGSAKKDKKEKEDSSKKEKKGKEKGSKKEKKDKKEDNPKKGKGKKSKSTKSKSKDDVLAKAAEPPPEIIITEQELHLNYLDLYPAEMFYWRNLKPYYIKTKFTCKIEYKSEEFLRKSEIIYLYAKCKVIKPDFITKLKIQRVDFGYAVVGMANTERIVVQNINYEDIKLNIGLLNPTGPFSIPYMKSLIIPPEHFLEIPITFEPLIGGQVEEYFDISSRATTIPIILQGIGEFPNIYFIPDVRIFRLQTSKNKIAECPIEIINENESKVTIIIEKVFEIEGIIKDSPKITKTMEKLKENMSKKSLSPKIDALQGNARSKSSVRSKSIFRSKSILKSKSIAKSQEGLLLEEMSEGELVAIKKYFTKKNDNFCFDVWHMENDRINLQSYSSAIINVCFGTPEILLKKKIEMEKAKQKKKNKKDKGSKKSKSSNSKKSKGTKESKKSEKSKDSKKSKGAKDNKKLKGSKGSKKSKKSKNSKTSKDKKAKGDKVYHIAKYNFMLNNVFIKDIILICTFN